MPDHYALLEVSRDATLEQLKKAYRKKALEHAPDKQAANLGRPLTPEEIAMASQKFNLYKDAYEILSDAEKRAAYDRQLAAEANANSRTGSMQTTAPIDNNESLDNLTKIFEFFNKEAYKDLLTQPPKFDREGSPPSVEVSFAGEEGKPPCIVTYESNKIHVSDFSNKKAMRAIFDGVKERGSGLDLSDIKDDRTATLILEQYAEWAKQSPDNRLKVTGLDEKHQKQLESIENNLKKGHDLTATPSVETTSSAHEKKLR